MNYEEAAKHPGYVDVMLVEDLEQLAQKILRNRILFGCATFDIKKVERRFGETGAWLLRIWLERLV